MTIEGVDYSFDHPSPAGLAAAGKKFACRYLSYTAAKNLTAAERDALWDAGLAIVLNWEAAAGGVLGGESAGREHASEAKWQAHLLGAHDAPVYFSADVNLTPTQIHGPVRAYYEACAGVLGTARVGAYGEYDLLEAARSWGTVTWLWQTAAYGWSPAGRFHPAAHLTQYRNGVALAGGTVDLDRARTDHYGQWEEEMDARETGVAVWETDGYIKRPVQMFGEDAGPFVQGKSLIIRTFGEVQAVEKRLTVRLDEIEKKIDLLLAMAHAPSGISVGSQFSATVTSVPDPEVP